MQWVSSLIRMLRGIDTLARQDYDDLISKRFDHVVLQLALKTGGGLAAIANPVLRRASSGIPYGVWCGVWPDSSYDVHVERTKRGAVILVSTGFLQAVVDFAYLVMHQVKLDGPDPVPLKKIPQSDVTKYLERIVQSTRPPTTGCVPPVGALPGTVYHDLSSMTGLRAKMLNGIIVSTIGFAIAHEAAHIRLGHLERATRRLGPDKPDQEEKHGLPEDRRKMANIMFSWSDELDTDAEALRIMLRVPNNNREEPYFGVAVFAELTDAILKSEAASRYPHPIMRRSAAIGTVHPESLSANFPLCDPLVHSMEMLRYGAWPQSDLEALNRISGWGEEFKPDEFPRGQIVAGVVRVLSVDSFIAADFTRARACVAYLGLSARAASRVVSGALLIRFATCYESFRRTYDSHQEWAETDRLLRLVFTDLDWTLELWRQSVVRSNQFPQPPPDTSPTGIQAPIVAVDYDNV